MNKAQSPNLKLLNPGRVSAREPACSRQIEDTPDARELRRTLGHFATGVTVVTAETAEGRRAAITANSFTSGSLEPPLVSVCIAAASASLPVIRRAGAFAVHVLDAEQEHLARTFACPGPDKLERVALSRSALGNPLLPSWLALLECELYVEYPGGDHRIVLGRVRRCVSESTRRPALGFFRSRFGALHGH